jgi:hypothetical protein
MLHLTITVTSIHGVGCKLPRTKVNLVTVTAGAKMFQNEYNHLKRTGSQKSLAVATILWC